MIIKHGDVFTTDATYIGHGVNCVGLMGAGIAKTVREQFPQVYAEYKYLCDTKYLRPGAVFCYPENGKVIVNLATQDKPGPDARYNAVFCSLYSFSSMASKPEKIAKNGNIIAIPQIGAGIGGLEWDKVEKIIQTIEYLIPEIVYEVWIYGG